VKSRSNIWGSSLQRLISQSAGNPHHPLLPRLPHPSVCSASEPRSLQRLSPQTAPPLPISPASATPQSATHSGPVCTPLGSSVPAQG